MLPRLLVSFLAGAAFGALMTLNYCAVVRKCAAPEQEAVLNALERARARLQQAMADAQRREPHYRAQNVVAPPACTPCRPCRDERTTPPPPPPNWTPPPPNWTPPKDSVAAEERYFLVGLVMHVERATTDYLEGTLDSLAASELALTSRVLGARSLVVVRDASSPPSRVFLAAERRFGANPLFRFDKSGSARRAPERRRTTRSQSRDVAAAVRSLFATTPHFAYALLLEDDWVACRGLVSSIVLGLEAAVAAFGDDLAALRVSYGLNGVVVPRHRLPSLADSIVERAHAKPPDHAFTDWALAEGRLVTFRHNAFVHVGSHSSIGNSAQRWNAACYELLFDWLQPDVEAFQVGACAHDVISPCRPFVPNHHPAKRRKEHFPCHVALQDLPAYRASNRLLRCLSRSVLASSSEKDKSSNKDAQAARDLLVRLLPSA